MGNTCSYLAWKYLLCLPGDFGMICYASCMLSTRINLELNNFVPSGDFCTKKAVSFTCICFFLLVHFMPLMTELWQLLYKQMFFYSHGVQPTHIHRNSFLPPSHFHAVVKLFNETMNRETKPHLQVFFEFLFMRVVRATCIRLFLWFVVKHILANHNKDFSVLAKHSPCKYIRINCGYWSQINKFYAMRICYNSMGIMNLLMGALHQYSWLQDFTVRLLLWPFCKECWVLLHLNASLLEF